MAQSMTGFGSAEQSGCRIEIRSLNQKFLDINIKAPSFLAALDIPFRNAVKERFSRGKFDVGVTISGESSAELHLNIKVADEIVASFRKLQKEISVHGEIDVNTLMGMHDMFIETKQQVDSELVMEVFRSALENLHAMRMKEGATLRTALTALAESLLGLKNDIAGRCEGVLSSANAKFSERMQSLLEGREIESSRILQEAAIMAARLDITEELTRLESHGRQFTKALDSGDVIGRKLDFILQECNREVNTIASKSVDYDISSLAVEMKTVIEQLREQVQNIQ